MANYAQLISQAQRSIAAVTGVTVTYSRGSSSIQLTAVPASTNFDADGDQVITEYRARDFIVAASDLVLNGSSITPQRGDTIDEVVGDEIHTFQVGRPNGGQEQPWRYSDTGRSTIRIHTLLKGVTG